MGGAFGFQYFISTADNINDHFSPNAFSTQASHSQNTAIQLTWERWQELLVGAAGLGSYYSPMNDQQGGPEQALG